MIKKYAISTFICLTFLGACVPLTYKDTGGQAVFHWQKANTGVEKFSRDHIYCLRQAEPFSIINTLTEFYQNMFYSEEKKLDIRADWKSETGIWATYVPYPGAQPLIVNSVRDDTENDVDVYVACMKSRGYMLRHYDIPEITNIYLHGTDRYIYDY